MTTPLLNDPTTTYPITGDNTVERFEYRDGKVWINQTQYFGDVSLAAWDFYVAATGLLISGLETAKVGD